MAVDGEVRILIQADGKEAIKSVDDVKNSIEGIDETGDKTGRSLGSKIATGLKVAGAVIAASAVAIGKVVSSSLAQGADLQQSLGGVETLFKGSADKVKKYANEAYKTAGLSANDYMTSVTSFSASLLQSMGGDTEKAADKANMALIDMSDNANKMGTNMQDIQNAYQGFAKQNYTMLDNLKLGYGGTKEEMQRLLSDAEKLTGVKYDINNLADVYDAIHAVQEELDITGTTAKESAETFSGSLASMKSAYNNVLGKMSLGMDITDDLNALAKTVSTFLFGNFIPMVGNVLKALPTAVGTLLQTGFTEMFNRLGVSVNVNGFFKKIKSAFEPLKLIAADLEVIFQAVGGVVSDFFGVLSGGSSATSIFISMADAVNRLLTWISEGTLQVALFMDNFRDTSAFQSFMSQVQLIMTNLKTGFSNLSSVVMQTLGVVLGQIPGLFGTMVSAVLPIISTISAAIANLDFSGFQIFVSAIVPAIQNAFSTLMAIVAPAVTSVVNSFIGLWNAAQPLIAILAEALMPAFQIVGACLGGVFKGILMGVSAAFSLATNVIKILTPVVKFLVAALKSAAPALSEVAEWVGVVIGTFTSLTGSGTTLRKVLSNAWTNIKSIVSIAGKGISSVISMLKSVFSALGHAGGSLRSVLSAAWNGIKSVVSVAGNGISAVINVIKSVFSALGRAGSSLKSGLSGVWNGIRSIVSSAGSAIKSVISAVSSAFSAMASVFSSVGSRISGIVGGVRNTLSGLANINLSGAGSAIMNGFLGGLQSAFEGVKNFVGGVASWIAEHKGPISYDRKLLIPAGNAIMEGLNHGLERSFLDVQKTVTGMADSLSMAISPEVVFPSAEMISGSTLRVPPASTSQIYNTYNNQSQQQSDRALEIPVTVYLSPDAPRELGFATAKYVEQRNNFESQRRNRGGGIR